MDVMQKLPVEVDGGVAEVIRPDLEDDLEETVEEPLMKRRSTTKGFESIITAVDSSETTSSDSGDASPPPELVTAVDSSETTLYDVGDASPPPELVTADDSSPPQELVTADEPAHEDAGDSVQKNRGSEIDWSQLNIKREDLAAKFKDADIEELMSAAIHGRQIAGRQFEYREATSDQEIVVREGEDVVYEMEESDEEVVELEFETAVQKMHSHDGYGMFCPNCSSQITKVVLRRKIKKRKVLVTAQNERRNLVGCLSCFSIFIPSGNKLNPFRIFDGGDRDESHQLREQPPASHVAVPPPESAQATADSGKGLDSFWFWKKRRVDGNGLTAPLLPAEAATSTTVVSDQLGDEASQQGDQSIQLPEELPVSDVTMAATNLPQAKGKRFGLFGFLRKGRDDENALNSQLLSAAAQIHSSSNAFTSSSVAILQSTSIAVSSKPRDEAIEQGDGVGQQEKDEKSDANETLSYESITTSVAVGDQGQEQTVVSQTSQSHGSVIQRNVVIDVHGKHGGDVRIPIVDTPLVTVTTRSEIVTVTGPSWSMDILKSIVYGGLMESITSLLVVSLATSLNSTTRNVVAIGLAFLVGGFFLLLHHLRALRYGDSSQTSEQTYNEQLGRQSRFPLHTIVASVSYIVCGLMPPLIYNFTFRETDDWELKMVAVSAASFACIFVLAIAQAYVRGENRFMAYFKTVVYYVVLAAIASGAAFGIGYLLKDPVPCPAVLVNSA